MVFFSYAENKQQTNKNPTKPTKQNPKTKTNHQLKINRTPQPWPYSIYGIYLLFYWKLFLKENPLKYIFILRRELC